MARCATGPICPHTWSVRVAPSLVNSLDPGNGVPEPRHRHSLTDDELSEMVRIVEQLPHIDQCGIVATRAFSPWDFAVFVNFSTPQGHTLDEIRTHLADSYPIHLLPRLLCILREPPLRGSEQWTPARLEQLARQRARNW